MQRLWDFVNEYPQTVTKLVRGRIPGWVGEGLGWWNNPLPTYNGVLFFNTYNRYTISLYIDTCFYSLGSFFFKDKRDWPIAVINQVNAFQAIINGKTLQPNKRMTKNSVNPNINIYKVEDFLLTF